MRLGFNTYTYQGNRKSQDNIKNMFLFIWKHQDDLVLHENITKTIQERKGFGFGHDSWLGLRNNKGARQDFLPMEGYTTKSK